MRRAARIGATVALAAALVGAWAPTAPAATTRRLAGTDRYGTAAAVSAATFAPGVPVAYVATGEAFPDALAAGAAAARAGGPVLLVRRDALPEATAAELDRLRPGRVVVLGGTAAVGEAVAAALAGHSGGGVTRIAGADRFGTAAAVSAATFSPGVPVAYVASGLGFPDALGAAPAAAVGGGPVLLTAPDALPEATAAELGRLRPALIRVVGGPAAVGPAVEERLRAYGPVERVGGADRYGTAAAVSRAAFGAADAAFVATGENFPDALAGGAAAGAARAPMLLVRRDCAPEATRAELARLAPETLWVLGGPAAVGPEAAAGAACPVAFGDGTWRVGADVPPGLYRTRADAPGCYWERLSGFSGTLDDVIANDYTDFHSVVEIRPGDAGFRSRGCGTWTNDMSPLKDPYAPTGDGTWTVGSAGGDVAPGTWRAPGGPRCYWERLSGFGHELDDIVANDYGATNPIVTVAASDAGFATEGCGTWTWIG